MKKYVIVGVGSRSQYYQEAIQTTYTDHAEIVGFCDINEGRLRLAQQRSMDLKNVAPPVYDAHDFDRMIDAVKPDIVIVTTFDGSHHEYIIRSMELGCDVITEKPMTTDSALCQQIIDIQRQTGQTCRVAFNYRYSPARTQVKELLMSGIIGEVLSVDFQWLLNTYHGADYFRRWHSQKKVSGGLMVHKATHHFDLVNWWLSAVPVSVFATGKRKYYTPEMARRLGLKSHHERCLTCPEKTFCGFELDLTASPKLKSLYLDCEQYDGYFRDRCVFRPDIDIEDTMKVLVTYDNDVTLSYSLNTFSAWEGYHLMFNGTKGRIEHSIREKAYISGTETEQGGIEKDGVTTRVIPLRDSAKEIEPWIGDGGHGGGDKLLLDDLFLNGATKDKYLRAADHRAGAYSILTGIAANLCFETKKAILIRDLIDSIDYPDFPAMPPRADKLPMPSKS